MKGVALAFAGSAAVYLTVGMLLGIGMGMREDFTLAPAHAHLNLVGGVLMVLFGLFYHVVPKAAASRLARPHFGVATLGVWMLPTGIGIAETGGSPLLAILGSFVVLASTLMFLAVIVRSRA